MSELKPCPFCASPCDECRNEEGEGYLGCSNDKCPASKLAMTDAEWNRRDLMKYELDRIAGPLAEALAESLNELRRICKEPNWLIGVGSEVLENYRKERGE